jgi:hypothetical protein
MMFRTATHLPGDRPRTPNPGRPRSLSAQRIAALGTLREGANQRAVVPEPGLGSCPALTGKNSPEDLATPSELAGESRSHRSLPWALDFIDSLLERNTFIR